MKNRAPWGYAGAIGLTKYRNCCQNRQTPMEKMQIEIGYPLKTHVFGGVALPIMGAARLFSGKQPDHDINLPPKFYQDRIKTHRAMLGTDRQTDRQTHTYNEYSGHLLTREPIKCPLFQHCGNNCCARCSSFYFFLIKSTLLLIYSVQMRPEVV